MHVVIVIAHPDKNSLNHGILNRVLNVLQSRGCTNDVIDINADRFDPICTKADILFAWKKGPSPDPMVIDYQDRIKKADYLIFLFPVWCWSLPAILKGFFDRIFSCGWAWEGNGFKIKGKLTDIKGSLIVATFASPKFVNELIYRNPMYTEMIKGGLKVFGIKKIKYIPIHSISGKESERPRIEKKINKIESFLQNTKILN